MKTIAIIGRPNVGKSTLFNRLIGDRLAVEDETPGTTRDPVSARMTIDDHEFILMDSGGVDFSPSSSIEKEVQEQVEFIGEVADAVIFVVSLSDGCTSLDRKIARKIRSSFLGQEDHQEGNRQDETGEVILVANKVDTSEAEQQRYDFYELGFGAPLETSALQRRGLAELRSRMLAIVKGESGTTGERSEQQEGEEPYHIVTPVEGLDRDEDSSKATVALIGRQNVGKSTFINQLSNHKRAIVTDVPGTTRDLLNVQCEDREYTWNIFDTPGFQKRGNEDNTVEMWSQKRVVRAIRKSDVIFHLFDATEEITRVDQNLQNNVQDYYKPCALIINKWDRVSEDISLEEYSEYFYDQLPSTRHCPMLATSALKNFHVWESLHLADRLLEQAQETVSSSELEEAFRECVESNPPSQLGEGGGSPPASQIFSVKQEGTCPPHIVAKLENPTIYSENDRRYLHNALREKLPFFEVPFRLTLEGPGSRS